MKQGEDFQVAWGCTEVLWHQRTCWSMLLPWNPTPLWNQHHTPVLEVLRLVWSDLPLQSSRITAGSESGMGGPA